MTTGIRPALRFRMDGTFLIAQLTDIHWRDGGPDDRRSRDLIERVLDTETPDLVAITGDAVEGAACRDPAVALREAVAPIEARGIPWAMCFGNHDDEGALSRLDLLRVQQALPCCLTERGPAALTGVGNYVLRVAGSRGDTLAAGLYFLDSGSYAETGPGDYAWIARDQIAWYLEQARRFDEERAAGSPGIARLPALAFFHLPLPEYENVWDLEPCRGRKLEAVCCPALDSGLFAALVETGDVMGVFVGHDHLNDFEGERHGIRLCYGRASGYSGYGRDDFARGARLVRLREGERGLETWLRLDDGAEVREGPVHPPRGRSARDEEA